MADFTQFLADLAPPSGDGPLITFTGSGDYHHLTGAMLAANGAEPISVLHFDNHPDWVRFPPAWHCGSWVNRALDLPQVRRVVTLGPTANDLDRPQWKGGNLPALASGKLELWPWRHAPSRVWGDIASGPGHRRQDGHLVWTNLADDGDFAIFDDILARLPTPAVWLTIDKDALRPADAVTNWDQGGMPLSWLLDAIARIAARTRLVGVDICGEYSRPHFKGWLKTLSARLDQPAAIEIEPDLTRNETTNRLLLDSLRGAL